MKTTIYTPYDCILKFNDKELSLSQNEHLSFEENIKTISVYPLNKNKKYSFEINLKDSDSTFYRVIKKEDKLLVFLLEGLISENIDIYSFSNEKGDSFVEIGKNTVIFKSDKHQKVITLSNNMKDFSCGNFEHIDYVTFKDDKKEYILAYNIVSNKAKFLQGDKIEIKDSGFIVTCENNEFYKSIIEEYFIDKEGLKSKSKTFSKKDVFPNNFVVYSFMNAIKLKDYESAHSYLTKRLKKEISIQSLKSYFGDVSYFYVIDPQTCFAITFNKNVLYDFVLKDDEIEEINDNL